MSVRPEPARDQQTIGSWKKTTNAALLIWVTLRADQPPPHGPRHPRRLLLAGAVGAALVALGADPMSLPGLR